MSELATLPEHVEAVESQILQLREEMRGEFSAMRDEVRGDFAAVRQEIRDGDQKTRRYMCVLHEEVLDKISLIGEARRSRRKR